MTMTLAPQQKQLVKLLVDEGLCAKDIADRMRLTHGTIATYKQRLFRRLDLHSTLGLVRWARLNPEAWA